MTIKVLFLLAFDKVWCNNISPSATQEKGTLNLSCSDAKFETCPCWSPLLLTHYCYIVVGREYHLWSYNFFSSRLVKWCYIYIILYTLCNMIFVYIYIFLYTPYHIMMIFFTSRSFLFGPFWESCFPWAFPGHHAFTNAMTAAQIVERRHKEGKTKLYLGVSSRSFHSSPPSKKGTIFTRGDFLNGNLFLEDQS